MDLEAAINRIKYFVFVDQGWTKNQLAQHADVPFNVVAKIHDEDWNPTLQSLQQLENVVPKGFSLAQLTANFTQPEKESQTWQAKIKTKKPKKKESPKSKRKTRRIKK